MKLNDTIIVRKFLNIFLNINRQSTFRSLINFLTEHV